MTTGSGPSRLRVWWDRRRDVRRNAADLACWVHVAVQDDSDRDKLLDGPIRYDSLLDLPRPLRRRAVRALAAYYTRKVKGYPWGTPVPPGKPVPPAVLTIKTRTPEKYLLTDTETGEVWRNDGRGWKYAKGSSS